MALAVEDQIALNGSHPSLAHVQAAISAAHRLVAAHTVAKELTPQERQGFIVPPGFQPLNPLLPGPRLDFPTGHRLDPQTGRPISRYPDPDLGAVPWNPLNPGSGNVGGGVVPYAQPGAGGLNYRPDPNEGYLSHRTDYYGTPGGFPFPPPGPDQGYTTNPAILAARRLLLAHRESPVVRT